MYLTVLIVEHETRSIDYEQKMYSTVPNIEHEAHSVNCKWEIYSITLVVECKARSAYFEQDMHLIVDRKCARTLQVLSVRLDL